MTDLEAVRITLDGNAEAYRFLVEKYQSMVFSIAVGFVHVRQDAEDITQDVFIVAYRSLASFQNKSEFRTWLYRIALNTSITYASRKKRHRLLMGATIDEEQLQTSGGTEPQTHQERKEVHAEIRRAIDELPDNQRKAFVLSKYKDLGQREIAQIMNISEGAVEQLMQRAKKNLQKKLGHLVGK